MVALNCDLSIPFFVSHVYFAGEEALWVSCYMLMMSSCNNHQNVTRVWFLGDNICPLMYEVRRDLYSWKNNHLFPSYWYFIAMIPSEQFLRVQGILQGSANDNQWSTKLIDGTLKMVLHKWGRSFYTDENFIKIQITIRGD